MNHVHTGGRQPPSSCVRDLRDADDGPARSLPIRGCGNTLPITFLFDQLLK